MLSLALATIAPVAGRPARADGTAEPLVALTVIGLVRDEAGRPLAGRVVEVRDDHRTLAGTVSDLVGTYRLAFRSSPGERFLVVLEGSAVAREERLVVTELFEGATVVRDLEVSPATARLPPDDAVPPRRSRQAPDRGPRSPPSPGAPSPGSVAAPTASPGPAPPTSAPAPPATAPAPRQPAEGPAPKRRPTDSTPSPQEAPPARTSEPAPAPTLQPAVEETPSRATAPDPAPSPPPARHGRLAGRLSVGASAPAPLPYTSVPVFYATDRAAADDEDPRRRYAGRRHGRDGLDLGVAMVTIPRDHRLAALESPSIWRLELAEDPDRHVVVSSVTPRTAEAFYAELGQRVARSARREALVYVHGFLTSWEDSLRVTAQLAYDLQFDGAPIVFSWPAGERLSAYSEAAASAEWSTPHLVDFLRDLRDRTGASSVHLVAHSMGNRLVTRALHQLALRDPARQPLFNQVVLAAPDVDAAVFRQLAGDVLRTGRRVTLYASSNDQALKVSMRMHAYPRAGLSGAGLLVLPGIDTIDVSEVDSSLLGHFYYLEATSVVSDLYALFKNWAPAAERRHLRALGEGSRRFWRVQRGLAPRLGDG